MKEVMKQLIRKVLTKEVISYLIFGVLTTLINIVIYQLCFSVLGIENLIANTIAWVISVLFAYITNKKYVFEASTEGKREEWKMLGAFLAARVSSLIVDEVGMWLLVDVRNMNGLWAKIIMNVIVVIINYVLSKCLVFKKRNKENAK